MLSVFGAAAAVCAVTVAAERYWERHHATEPPRGGGPAPHAS